MDGNFFNLNYGESAQDASKRGQMFNYLKTVVVLLFLVISGLVYVFYPDSDNIKVNIAEETLGTIISETQNFYRQNIAYENNNVSSENIKTESEASIDRSSSKNNKSKNIPLLVNINTAPSKELEKINGIGVSLAKNIIDYRTRNGGFAHKEEIKNVRGVGDKLYEKIKDYIVVD